MTLTAAALAHWPTLDVPTSALPAWRVLAAVLAETPPACAGMTALFDDPAYVEPAEATCQRCPAITVCAAYADPGGTRDLPTLQSRCRQASRRHHPHRRPMQPMRRPAA